MVFSRRARVSVILGVLVGSLGIRVGGSMLVPVLRAEPPKDPPAVKLDSAEYMIVATIRAAREYKSAIDKAKALHPNAVLANFDPRFKNDLADYILPTLRDRQTR